MAWFELYAVKSKEWGGCVEGRGEPRDDVGLTVILAIEESDMALTPENCDESRGEEGAVKDCATEGMNLS